MLPLPRLWMEARSVATTRPVWSLATMPTPIISHLVLSHPCFKENATIILHSSYMKDLCRFFIFYLFIFLTLILPKKKKKKPLHILISLQMLQKLEYFNEMKNKVDK
jgi:hypothetical protein